MAPGDGRAIAETLDLVDAAVYADVFDTAVTFATLHRFARAPIDRDALAGRLDEDPLVGVALERHASGAYTLSGRSRLADGFAERAARAARLRRRAVRVGRVLRHVPFVRGILLTGSVAAGDAPADADVDVLVVVADDRIGTVFAVLGTVSRVLGRRLFCPNFYLEEEGLALEGTDVYVGRELGQSQGVVGDAAAFRDANPWLDEMFPNLARPRPAPLRTGSALQRGLEAPLVGRAGQALERWARALARSRLRAHYADGIPPEVALRLERGEALRFHSSGVEGAVPALYKERRIALAEALRAGQSTVAHGPA